MRHLATGRTADALQACANHAMGHAGETRTVAQTELIARWDKDRLEHPDQTRIILTHTNEARHALNAAAGRTQRAIRILQLEAELQADPVKRADRFVNDRTRLELTCACVGESLRY
ncbi:MAG: hypothetical protein ACK4OJ_01230 [Brevundimonas sp.]|jgi:hypothetical protein